MLLCTTLFPADFAAPDPYSIQTILITAYTLAHLIGTAQTVPANGEMFEHFLL